MNKLNVKTIRGENYSLDQNEIDQFASELKGELLNSEHTQYNETRAIWNGMIDRRPALIARCADTDDVVRAVRFAKKHNLLVSLRSGGHHVAGQALCENGLVIDMSKMNKVDVDPEARIARVQAGARLADVDQATEKYDLAAPLGVVSATGVTGLTLHGGLGWLTRKHGLSLDNVTSFDVVTADGKLVRASEDENSDLFWALRGGGGNFGAVTSLEFRLHPVSPKVWMLFSIYPLSMSKKGLELVRDSIADAPEEMGLISVFWSGPEEEFIPEEYQGEPVFIFLGCYHGSLEDGEKVIAPFRELGEPIADLSEPVRFADMQKVLDPDYPDGRHYYWKSTYLNQLDDDTIERLIEHARNRPSPLTSLDIWSIGGALNRVDPSQTAFVRRNARYLVGIESNWDDPADDDANIKWARDVYDDMIKNDDAGAYLNFPGFGEEGQNLIERAYGENYKRMRKIKAKYDPDNFFCGFLKIE